MNLSLMHLAALGLATTQLGSCIFLRGDHATTGNSFLHPHRKQAGVRKTSLKLRNQTLKPHIIFVLADDLGYNSIGYNNAEIRTPSLDKLANEGVKLHSYYAAPICGPSRFSLLTGRLPWKSEAWTSGQFQAGTPSGTSLSYTMLPAALKAVGYKTHLVGKWHQGYYSRDYHPQNRGFDTFYGALQGCVFHQSQQLCEANCNSGGRILDLTDSTRQLSVNDIDTSLVADDRYRVRAVELIRKHDIAEPFFLYISFHHPHLPLDTPVQYSSRFNFDEEEKNKYYGMISNMDDNVEHIRKALVRAGMWQNTLFIFASDNGASMQDIKTTNFAQYLNFPLRGHKGQAYEGGIKVPAFVSGGFLPDLARGAQLDGLTSNIDWYATLANLAGAHVDESGPYSSDSIANWEYISGKRNTSARTGLLQFAQSGFAYIEGKWKLYSDMHRSLSLFDLERDPSEHHDVSAEHGDMVSHLKTHFDEPAFAEFLREIERLRHNNSCAAAGFSEQAFALKFCPSGSDVFLKEFYQPALPGYLTKFRNLFRTRSDANKPDFAGCF